MGTLASGHTRSSKTARWIRSRWGSAKRIALVSVLAALVVAAAVAAAGSGAARVGETNAASSFSVVERVSGGPKGTYIVPPGIHKIKHVIVIQQENRSFDYLFRDLSGC